MPETDMKKRIEIHFTGIIPALVITHLLTILLLIVVIYKRKKKIRRFSTDNFSSDHIIRSQSENEMASYQTDDSCMTLSFSKFFSEFY